MFVEEIIYNNIQNIDSDYENDIKKAYFELTLTILEALKKVSYSEDNLEYVKGNNISWVEIKDKIYRLPLNYNMDYQIPCGYIATILEKTLNEIKEIVGKKRNKIAFEYLMGYREDKKISLLKNSEDNKFLKRLVYD